MNCKFQSPRDEFGFNCSLNRYGGKPHAIACERCIESGLNNELNALPSPTALVKSLKRAVGSWSQSGFEWADKATFTSRVNTCLGCDEFDAAGMVGTGRCRKCGCSIQAKLRMATEKCPLGKW